MSIRSFCSAAEGLAVYYLSMTQQAIQLTLLSITLQVINDVVSAVNAPRRTATYDVQSAWDALCDTSEPASVLKNTRLKAARAEVSAEVVRK